MPGSHNGRHKVFVARRLPQRAMEQLNARGTVDLWPEPLPPPPEVLRQRAAGCHGLLTLLTDRVDQELLAAAGDQLRVVSNYAIGVDNIDVEAATARGVLVCNTPDVLTETTADLTFALILAAARRLTEAAQFVHQGAWRTWDPLLLLGHDVYGGCLGIIGMGRIGQAVARRAAGFGMSILYQNPRPVPEIEQATGAQFVERLAPLLAAADFVSLHAPLTDRTRGLINRETLAAMKPSAFLVNTARGPLVDTAALVVALQQGVIAGAALDVTDPEPLSPTHPLLSCSNCLVLPHVGSATLQTREKMALLAVENLHRALSGQRPTHLVNPTAWEIRRGS